jgi:pantoate--beta-alanine ligase
MKFIPNPVKLSAEAGKIKRMKRRIGLVPTMGALHDGHFSLIRRARRENDIVVVSIFVNPAQFGPKEDLRRYPRNIKKDIDSCRKLGVDVVFLPETADMYPEGYSTFVNVSGLSDVLCGASRPGHFRGVATVIVKLLNIIRPDTLYMGQKDAQQAIIVSRLVEDLNFPVKVRVVPTVRQEDGLALSSRNAYLSEKDRRAALALSKSLKLAETLIRGGQRNAARIKGAMSRLIEKDKRAKIDYIEIVDAHRLKPVKKINSGDLIALAVKIGKTRLIDNMVIVCA